MGNFFGKLKPFFHWLKTAYSESDGNGSSTRVHMAAIIAFVLGVGVSFTVSVHHKLVTIEQFDGFLSAGATFIVTCCGALYGINKVSSWAEGKTQAEAQTQNMQTVVASVADPAPASPPVPDPTIQASASVPDPTIQAVPDPAQPPPQ